MHNLHYDGLPKNVCRIIETFNDSEDAYEECWRIRKELHQIGWDCDYGLDGEITEIKSIK